MKNRFKRSSVVIYVFIFAFIVLKTTGHYDTLMVKFWEYYRGKEQRVLINKVRYFDPVLNDSEVKSKFEVNKNLIHTELVTDGLLRIPIEKMVQLAFLKYDLYFKNSDDLCASASGTLSQMRKDQDKFLNVLNDEQLKLWMIIRKDALIASVKELPKIVKKKEEQQIYLDLYSKWLYSQKNAEEVLSLLKKEARTMTSLDKCLLNRSIYDFYVNQLNETEQKRFAPFFI